MTNQSKFKKGEFKILEKCRFCDQTNLKNVLHFKNFPLAGSFLNNLNEISKELYFPLTLLFCTNCKSGFCKQIINQNNLFKNINNTSEYFYYSSKIPYLKEHFYKLAKQISEIFQNKKNILEIGCNDGVLLKPLKEFGFKVIGIDPSSTINEISEEEIIQYNSYFNETIVTDIINKYGKQDLIISCNCLAHIDDIDSIYKNIKKILKDDGIVIIEVHYFKNVIDNMNFDFIYHEHMSYYTINSFLELSKKYGFYIDDLNFIDTHGGSLRIFLKNNDINEKFCSEKINILLGQEINLEKNLDNMINNIFEWKISILKIINEFKNKDGYLIGYGASGRTNTILNFLNVKFDYIFDDSDKKINKYLPKFHTKIINSEEIYNMNIKTIFILAWPYFRSILNKHKKFIEDNGKFIIILPRIIIVDKENFNLSVK